MTFSLNILYNESFTKRLVLFIHTYHQVFLNSLPLTPQDIQTSVVSKEKYSFLALKDPLGPQLLGMLRVIK